MQHKKKKKKKAPVVDEWKWRRKRGRPVRSYVSRLQSCVRGRSIKSAGVRNPRNQSTLRRLIGRRCASLYSSTRITFYPVSFFFCVCGCVSGVFLWNQIAAVVHWTRPICYCAAAAFCWPLCSSSTLAVLHPISQQVFHAINNFFFFYSIVLNFFWFSIFYYFIDFFPVLAIEMIILINLIVIALKLLGKIIVIRSTSI